MLSLRNTQDQLSEAEWTRRLVDAGDEDQATVRFAKLPGVHNG